jgi:hypothetical protein
MRDDGYDIADYHNIYPPYGTRRDFRRFVSLAHRRGIRVITELVINHILDHHPLVPGRASGAEGAHWRVSETTEGPAHPHSRLIGMGDRRGDQRFANGGNRRLQAHGCGIDRVGEGARGEGIPGQRMEHRGGARERQQLVLGHLEGERRYAWPVL